MSWAYERAARLMIRIKRECKEYEAEEIGMALSSNLVEFAQHVGMSRETFMEMIGGLWDLSPEDAKAVRH